MASPEGEIRDRLTESAAIEVSPAWSPDGRRIAFVSDASGTPSVYVMSSSGGPATRITSGSYDTDPVWSPSSLVDRDSVCQGEKIRRGHIHRESRRDGGEKTHLFGKKRASFVVSGRSLRDLFLEKRGEEKNTHHVPQRGEQASPFARIRGFVPLVVRRAAAGVNA